MRSEGDNIVQLRRASACLANDLEVGEELPQFTALSILELFDNHTAELGITEMAKRLGLHKSTLAGLVYTLESSGYLGQNPTTLKYRLGVKLVKRAFLALGHLEVTRVALPHLERL